MILLTNVQGEENTYTTMEKRKKRSPLKDRNEAFLLFLSLPMLQSNEV